MTQSNNPTVAVAENYAQMLALIGWPVFPVSRRKIPFSGTHGHLDATTDPDAIAFWWRHEHPGALVGVACKRGVNDIFAVDVDTKGGHGVDGIGHWKSLLAENGGIPKTPVQRTPSGGLHYIFAMPDAEIQQQNLKTDKKPVGVDIRSNGSFVTGHGYKWGLSPFDVAPATPPVWLVDMIKKEPIPQRAPRVNLKLSASGKYDQARNAQAAMQAIAPARAETYDDWLAVGMALSELGEIGLALWQEWTQNNHMRKPEKYNPSYCAKQWRHIKPGGGITLGSLFYWAGVDA